MQEMHLRLLSVSLSVQTSKTIVFYLINDRWACNDRGDAAVLTHPDLRHAHSSWAIHKQWSNGHVGIVRALLWDDEVPFRCLIASSDR